MNRAAAVRGAHHDMSGNRSIATPERHTRVVHKRDLQRWRPEFARIHGKIYLAIADQIEQAIRAGTFRPGDRLPPQRDIAGDLGFHLNTINAAFREAACSDLIESRSRSGSIISSRRYATRAFTGNP